MQAVIGKAKADGKPVALDVDVLLRTRLLVQANSGGGKSWLLRRLAEQLFGQVQVIIIDPEGEFATLREKYGYVLVGKGGETPADTRSAALVAHKLLELQACAVCDIFEMKPADRHRWVKLFLEALVDAPKRLWHPAVVIVDEAHVFAPEKGAGDSEAADAMIGLATRGRKRGFAAVLATQRLGKLRKDVAAECANVLIGQTFMDIDRDRAADALGIGGKGDRQSFYNEIRLLTPGRFYGLGRAIADLRVLLDVGPVQTSHPEPGSAKHAAAAPPAPKAVKALLPQLADLPQQAEEKARTEAELRAELAQVKRDLAAAEKAQPPPAPPERVEVPVLTKEQARAIDALAFSVEQAIDHANTARGQAEAAERITRQVAEEITSLRAAIAAATAPQRGAIPARQPRPSGTSPAPVPRQSGGQPARAPRHGGSPGAPAAQLNGGGQLNGPEQRILDAIAWLESIGVDAPEQTAVAFLAGYTYGGGAFNNPRGSLRTKGFVEYVAGDSIRLTDAGRSLANVPDVPLTTVGLHERVLERLARPEQRLLRPLLDAYPDAMTNEDLAAAASYTAGAGAFNNPRGRLRSLGLVEYPAPGTVRARSILFLQ